MTPTTPDYAASPTLTAIREVAGDTCVHLSLRQCGECELVTAALVPLPHQEGAPDWRTLSGP